MSAPLTIQVRLGFSMGWRIWSPNEVRFYTKTLAHSYFIYNILRSKLLAARIWIVNYSIFMGITRYSIFLEYLRFGLKHKEESLRWNKLIYLSLALQKPRGNASGSEKFKFIRPFIHKYRRVRAKAGIRKFKFPQFGKVRSVVGSRRSRFRKKLSKNAAAVYSLLLFRSYRGKLKNLKILRKKTLKFKMKAIAPLDTSMYKKAGPKRIQRRSVKKPTGMVFFYGGMYPPSFRKMLRSHSSKKILLLRGMVWFWQKLALMVSFYINKLERGDDVRFMVYSSRDYAVASR